MLNINPIPNINDYRLTRENKKVKPIVGVSKGSTKNGDNYSNSSNFQEILEEEIKKLKSKK